MLSVYSLNSRVIPINFITALLIVFLRKRRKKEITLALLLLNVEVSYENQVLANVKEIEGVKEAYVLFGVYDIVVKIRAKSMDALKNLITTQVRQLKQVKSTLTLILIEE